MISGKIVDKLTAMPDIISVSRSRCLRNRINESSCTACADICPSGAVTLGPEVYINPESCTECMLCVSACVADGLAIDNSKFYQAVVELRKTPAPVLGCAIKPEAAAHARTFCFGHISEEHILALIYFMRGPLQINMTECGGCKNAFIVDALEKRLQAVGEKTALKAFERIKLVRNKRELSYSAVSLDRRGFFEALKKSAFAGIAGLIDSNVQMGNTRNCPPEDALPPKRELLEKVLSGPADGYKERLLANYYYDLTVGESCNYCADCAVVCPTGALKKAQDESDCELLFCSSLCTGCGLCADFCESGSVRIVRGFPGPYPSDFTLKARSGNPKPAERGRRRSVKR